MLQFHIMNFIFHLMFRLVISPFIVKVLHAMKENVLSIYLFLREGRESKVGNCPIAYHLAPEDILAENPAKIVCVDLRTSRICSRSKYIAPNSMFT